MSAPYWCDIVWLKPEQGHPTKRLEKPFSSYNAALEGAQEFLRVKRPMLGDLIYAVHVYNNEGMLLSSTCWNDEENKPITASMV